MSINSHKGDFTKSVYTGINYIIKNGSLDKQVLFNKGGNVMELLDGKGEVAKRIIDVINQINGRLSV